MIKYRIVTLAIVALFLSVSFLASSVVAAELDGIIMKDGKLMMMQSGKEISRMDRETTLRNGAKVLMSGKIVMKDGKIVQLQEGQMVMLDGKLIEAEKVVPK
jgi:hypothetical protein